MIEQWKDIPGFEKYEVSDQGRVRNIKTGRVLKGRKISGGRYLGVILSNSLKELNPFSIHRLVLLAFRGSSKLQADHLNMDGHDNRLCNLEYVTPSENMFRQAAKRTTISGFTGVSVWGRKFRARIMFEGVRYFIGVYPTPEEASQAYLDKRDELIGSSPCTAEYTSHI